MDVLYRMVRPCVRSGPVRRCDSSWETDGSAPVRVWGAREAGCLPYPVVWSIDIERATGTKGGVGLSAEERSRGA